MNKFVTENLMLLEFLVDEIYFTPRTKKKIDSVNGETNVMFQFLDNKPIIITAEDLYASCSGKDKRSGKSCLFSMSTEQGIEALGNFLIKMKIFQKFPPGVLPNVIDIACGDICISELFQDLMESAMGSEEKAWVKCQKETVKIYMCGECVGSVSVFVRMSCYGKYIVTQCEMNVGDFQKEMSNEGNCQSDSQEKKKALPPSDQLVATAQNATKKKPKEIPRQMGETISSRDSCNMIKHITDNVCEDCCNKHDGFVNGAQQMAFKMLDPPPINKCVDNSVKNPTNLQMSQVPNSTIMSKAQPLPSNTYPLGVHPCDPCPGAEIPKIPEKEIIPRPPQKKPVLKRPSKDKILFRLTMPKYGPDDICSSQPYEFEFATPAGWPRESLGKQCRDGQCDCKDFPRGYLIEYYGENKLAELLHYQLAEEMRREKIYGICPVGEFAKVARPKKGGLAALYYKCLGVEKLMGYKPPKEKAPKKEKVPKKAKTDGKEKKKGKGGGGDKKGEGKKEGGSKKGKGGGGGKGGGKKGKGGGRAKGGGKGGGRGKGKNEDDDDEDDEDEESEVEEEPKKPKKSVAYFKPKRKLQSHAGITVPDRRRPPCIPCNPYEPCSPCAPCRRGEPCPCRTPYSPCGPCGPCRPCGPCGNRPSSTNPCLARPCSPGPCSEPCSAARYSVHPSSCASCYRN